MLLGRCAFIGILLLTLVGACSASEPADDSSPATTTTREPAPAQGSTTTGLTTWPTSLSTTTTDPISVGPRTLPAVSSLERGLFCRDLISSGYGYSDAIAYWVREGQPSRMDADGDAVPCETVYDSADVASFWGDPHPSPAPAEKPPAVLAELGRGLFCRDLEAMDFTFDQAVAYCCCRRYHGRLANHRRS